MYELVDSEMSELAGTRHVITKGTLHECQIAAQYAIRLNLTWDNENGTYIGRDLTGFTRFTIYPEA